MKLEHTDISAFAELISRARGQVTFLTEEGDRLVSGSLLSALVGLSALLKVSEQQHVEIICEDSRDREDFITFFASAAPLYTQKIS